jgi:uncharacterized repeat protein (TIGR03803 family)
MDHLVNILHVARLSCLETGRRDIVNPPRAHGPLALVLVFWEIVDTRTPARREYSYVDRLPQRRLAQGGEGTMKALRLPVSTAFAFATLMHPCNAQTLTTLYSFTGGANGTGPQAGLAMGANGVLYGTTLGGTTNDGTVFELIPPAAAGGAWTQRVIHEFAGPPGDGYYPVGTLAIGRDGALYGTTYEGGADGASIKAGTVFELTPPSSAGGDWTERIIHSFGGPVDGNSPESGVIFGKDGTLYGTTAGGGPFGAGLGFGTVFAMSPPAAPGGDWTETVLYSFGPDDGGVGGVPAGGLVIDGKGVLYGTTALSRASGYYGGVFALQPPGVAGGTWTEQVIHRFTGSPGDGDDPGATLVIGQNGVLYGTTQRGGSMGHGTVFAVTPPATPGGAWSEAILHSYGSAGDGGYLDGSLVAGAAGVLYGTTGRVDCLQQPAGDGTVFSLEPPAAQGGNWTNTVLYRFLDGFPANGNLLLGAGGTFYGTTAGACGAPDYGTVFALSSN